MGLPDKYQILFWLFIKSARWKLKGSKKWWEWPLNITFFIMMEELVIINLQIVSSMNSNWWTFVIHKINKIHKTEIFKIISNKSIWFGLNMNSSSHRYFLAAEKIPQELLARSKVIVNRYSSSKKIIKEFLFRKWFFKF